MLYLFQNIDWGKNVVIFGAENSSSVHTNNEKKDILVLGKGPRQRLDDTVKLNILLILQDQIENFV